MYLSCISMTESKHLDKTYLAPPTGQRATLRMLLCTRGTNTSELETVGDLLVQILQPSTQTYVTHGQVGVPRSQSMALASQ